MLDKSQEGVSLLALCAAEPETDIGNGRRFQHRHGRDVLFAAKIGWHGYDGLRWREDEDGSVVRPLSHQTAEAIRLECREISLTTAEELLVEAGSDAERDLPSIEAAGNASGVSAAKKAIAERDRILAKLEDRAAARARHAKSTAGSGKLDNMLKEAAPYLSKTVDLFNGEDLALNTRSGTLRFVRALEDPESDPDHPVFLWGVRLDDWNRDDLITKLCDAHIQCADGYLTPGPTVMGAEQFEEAARILAPTFFQFLQRVQPKVEMRRYLQRLSGYMLTGLTSEQMIAFFYGIGANGKSTFTDVIAKILADYAVTLSIDSFTGESRRSGAEATPDLARLNGARGCLASEGDEGAKLREGLIKLLTGGDKMAVRKLHQDFVEIVIKAKFVITGNHKPRILGDDDGIWRRVHLFEWGVQIPPAERDKTLPERLLAERDGILAWMISGALEFLSLGGLEPPKEVLAAVQEHREESDPVGAFIRVACDVTGEDLHSVSPGDLYLAYSVFCRQEGQYAFPQSTFTRRLPDQTRRSWKAPDGTMQMFSKRKSGATLYRGIRIKERFQPGPNATHSDTGDRPFAPRD
ncbi:phage/plasmid primase, P4 family [Aureimonas phyllosphaerae]|uniref:Putative DNA primase/helicase n=1 Tax=Aureimonas phyllosphaerae TaxID=1166078 RepID=A0A7W6FW38_9HYPH|nr:phage/plasmid primase, P4 family [Aureimonas phyllosphaerae]MBB3937919.1 putative DNA primase/helicase [Aureimonas phyllosphaerae]MBB3961908.1 putative DNA primase/helicase [Aureimonas phyllosphaerae]SFF54623.1 putative DNA primase/helicase [Aureimonas phyllosphaerae]